MAANAQSDTNQLAVHEAVPLLAASRPDKVAVACDGRALSYAELESRANQLAHALREQGARRGELVGICIERSVDMLVGLIGIMKSGAAYVPIDPAYPDDRVSYMLEHSGARLIVSEAALRDGLPTGDATVLCVDADSSVIARHPETPPPPESDPDDTAYVIYTSGSTGRPKGVQIPHRALTNFLHSMQREPGLSAGDRLLAVTTLSFDIAGLELYLPLLCGATVFIATRAMASDGVQLAQQLEAHDINVMQATPATWRLLLDSGWQGRPDLRVLCGGETLTRDLAERLLPKCDQLWNLYGPTETTIWSTAGRVVTGDGPVSIGSPIANTEIALLDDSLEPVADGEAGDLFIGGDGLAIGYYEREDLTAERFIDHPARPGTRLYRTGDLARRRADGTLDHLGRVDFQVKVRGFRIELGEIEAVLDEQETIGQSVVMAREDTPGDKRLVAYFVASSELAPSSRDLRAGLAMKLPDYMVPGIYVALDAFPLTPNGKVDRNALPVPDTDRPELADEYVAPETDEQRQLAALWSEVLRIERVGINDNFFELGGDSLKLAQVATRIREKFGLDVALKLMFEYPSIATLVPRIESLREAGTALPELPLAEVERSDAIPLSFAQERVWFLHQLNPRNLAYNFQSSVEFKGGLDVEALERSLDEILRRHESYRTSFPTVDGRPVQIVHPATRYKLPVVDLRDLPAEERENVYRAWCADEFQLRFDLAKIPLVRWTLLRFEDERNILIHMEHHLVHDGWSFNVFLRELVDLYRAFSAGQDSPFQPLPVQFAEFATWQHEWMQGAVSDAQLEYWKTRFQTIPPLLQMPTRGARPTEQTFRGTALRPEIPLDLCNDLRALARSEGSTLFMTMLAGFFALLHRYTDETDIAVGTFFANRRQRESEHLIGMILNNVVIRTALDDNPTVEQLMTRVRDLTLEGANFQDVPFDRVVETVQPQRDLSMNPLFQVMFSFHDEPMPEEALDGLDIKLTPVLSNGSAKFDLGVIGIPHSAQYVGLPQGSDRDGLTMIWEHNTDLFETRTIALMIEHYKTLLAAMVANPGQRVSDLPLTDAREQRRIVKEWNATATDWTNDTCVHELFASQVTLQPDAVAVVCEGRELSYGELDRRANQLAALLRERGVERETLVGLCVERSERMLVGLLGILKAGGAYVPIDPTFPAERKRFMVDDAELALLVTEGESAAGLELDASRLVRLDADATSIDAMSGEPPADTGIDSDSLAYVIYTSGSTGRPKGVQITHRSLSNFLLTMRETPGLDADDRLLAVTTLSFDIAGLELYLPLVVGARVIVCPRPVAVNGEALAAEIAGSGATVMQATPTTWQMLIDSGWTGVPRFRALCGGEALPRALAEKLLPLVGELWNMYGPTETTIWSTVERVESGTGAVPIGRPIGNTRVFVLDRYDNIVPSGVVGELCIGGAGVARGYLNRPELTAERFVPNPADEDGSTVYRTGDLARYRSDGTLECLGRTDHQIKLRGFRIELGEIESRLDALDGVAQAVALMREDVVGDARLVAYVVPDAEAELSPRALGEALGKVLPEYMVPSAIVMLDEMPLTPNGKVDRKALPRPTSARDADDAAYVAPTSEAERRMQEIWQDLLGVSRIGIRDDFFEAGGHSLLAVRLVSRIETEMGERIPLARLLQERTIEQLARGFDLTPASTPGSASGGYATGFVKLQEGSGRKPFFASGSSPRYRQMAAALGDDLPVFQLDLYALLSAQLESGQKPFRTIEQFAEYFLADLRKVQPTGPYYLGGGCEGAYVAFEMALRLQRAGETVNSLLMWIPPPLRETDGFDYRRSAPVVMARQAWYFLAGGGLKGAGLATLRVQLQHQHIEYLILRAMHAYSPGGRYDGEVTLIRTEHAPIQTTADLNKPWADRASAGASVHVVPGNHGDWLDRHLDEFVAVLKPGLETAPRAGR